jgi:hypothetical protein
MSRTRVWAHSSEGLPPGVDVDVPVSVLPLSGLPLSEAGGVDVPTDPEPGDLAPPAAPVDPAEVATGAPPPPPLEHADASIATVAASASARTFR